MTCSVETVSTHFLLERLGQEASSGERSPWGGPWSVPAHQQQRLDDYSWRATVRAQFRDEQEHHSAGRAPGIPLRVLDGEVARVRRRVRVLGAGAGVVHADGGLGVG